MAGDIKNPAHVQSVARAIQIMELLAEENRPMSLTEISKSLSWPKSTVHGLISTLRDYQYVDQSHTTGHYYLGIRLFEFGSQIARGWNIRTVALPVMQRINRQLGEMVQLATEDKGEVLYIEKLDSAHTLRIVSEIGSRLPMHCSGLGKAMLAYKTNAEIKWIINTYGLRRMTQRTITDPKALEQELAKIRRQKYAVDDREIMDGIRCVAAPIFEKDGKVRYAISMSALANNMAGRRLEEVIACVKEAADIISHEMGYRPR